MVSGQDTIVKVFREMVRKRVFDTHSQLATEEDRSRYARTPYGWV